jgi:hypothetical protein
MSDYLARLLAEEVAKAARRKCFVSYYSGDKAAVDKFIADFSNIFIPKAIGVSDGDEFINSNDSDYVMTKIREKYLGDSTITLCLIGNCTHSRRYVDWELKTTLRRGSYTPNGLVGILLPEMGTSGHLPSRFKENWNKEESNGYAIYRSYPTSEASLRGWIEDAYSRRTSHADLIVNTQEMYKYNRKCLVHDVSH